MRVLALAAIRYYQRYLSPLKGFHCAYCSATGRATCSNFGYRAINRHGVWIGLALLKRRTQRCAEAAHRLQAQRRRAPLLQRGDCDPGCLGGVDILPGPDCDLLPSAGSCRKFEACSHFADCNFGNCNWFGQSSQRRRSRRQR